MEHKDKEEELTLDIYIKSVVDQEIKGILLKLKNEMRRPDASRESIDGILQTLKEKNSGVAREVIPLIEYWTRSA